MISRAEDGPWPVAGQRFSLSIKKRLLSLVLGVVCAGVRIVSRLFARRRKEFQRTAIVMEPFGMGDIVSLGPLLKVLHHADWKVIVLAKGAWKDLIPSAHYEAWIASEFPWASYSDAQKYHSLGRVLVLLRKIRMQLASFSGALGIDPRGDVRSILFLHLLGCRDVVSLDHYTGSTLGVSKFAARTANSVPGDKRWQEILRLRSAVEIDTPQKSPILDYQHSETAETIAVLPVAPWSGKLWPAESWQELLHSLELANRQVIALCGPGQSAEVRHFVGTRMKILECTTVAEWTERLREVRLLVTVDTGPMHLASAVGVPVVALFGVTPLPLWAPSGSASLVVHAQDDSKFRLCQQIEANVAQGEFWMNRIRPVEVIEACRMALD